MKINQLKTLSEQLRRPNQYSSKRYSDINMVLRRKLWLLITEPHILQALMTATYCKKPAVAAIIPEILEIFDIEDINVRRVKMLLGSMVKHALTFAGYSVDQQDVLTPWSPVFGCANRYKK